MILDESGSLIGLLIGGDQSATSAIPGDEVLRVARAIIDCGCDFPRPDFGVVDVDTITSSNRALLGSPVDEGAVLHVIVPGSPFDEAGLRAGDIVLAIGEVQITELRRYHNVLKGVAPGETVLVTYWRDGEPRSVEVTSILRER